jgi:hypothetical protein
MGKWGIGNRKWKKEKVIAVRDAVHLSPFPILYFPFPISHIPFPIPH